MFENFLAAFKNYPEVNLHLVAGLIIFARFLGFIVFAPVISRKDIPFLIKIAFSFIMTIIFLSILSPSGFPQSNSLFLAIILNFVFGGLMGYAAAAIFAAITSAGDMVNMQMGLSSSMMFDPGTKEQISVMGQMFSLLGTVIYLNIGGFFWLISAFKRGFDIFPLYGTSIPIDKIVSLDYLVTITGNVLFIGLQMAAPVLVATLAMDIILGIISKTAPQVNVFQLSFLFKPVVGAAIIVIILPLLVNTINEYFSFYSKIF
jgi:flagellar biosynthesis protein FliR